MTEKEIKALQEENKAYKEQIASLQEAYEAKEKELLEENENLKQELSKLQEANSVFTKEVPGTYKSKKHGVTVSFKKGYLKTRYKNGLVASADMMKESDKYADFLDSLIEMKYAGLQIVKD